MKLAKTPHEKTPGIARDEPMHPVQIERFRKMTVAEKFDAITMMHRSGIELRIIGLRMRNPDWPAEKLASEARKAAMYASTY